jgi:hypothetical protein
MTLPDTRDPGKTLRTSDNASDPAVSWKVKCLNCGAALAGPFCAECGQRALPPHPTVRELVGDAIAEFVGWDGKLANTLRLLLRRPGELTRQWLEGRRVHFISPLRLYFTASLVYFLIAASAPTVAPTKTFSFNARGQNSAGTAASQTTPDQIAMGVRNAGTSGKPLSQARRDSLMRKVAKLPWVFQPLVRRAIDNPVGLKAAIIGMFPRMFFALLPLYAGILALFYHRRKYPEHLYFALHLHTFAFIALTIPKLGAFAHLPTLNTVLGTAVLIWLLVYYVIAARRVYGGSLGTTLLKGVGIAGLYALVAMPTVIAFVVVAAAL